MGASLTSQLEHDKFEKRKRAEGATAKGEKRTGRLASALLGEVLQDFRGKLQHRFVADLGDARGEIAPSHDAQREETADSQLLAVPGAPGRTEVLEDEGGQFAHVADLCQLGVELGLHAVQDVHVLG